MKSGGKNFGRDNRPIANGETRGAQKRADHPLAIAYQCKRARKIWKLIPESFEERLDVNG